MAKKTKKAKGPKTTETYTVWLDKDIPGVEISYEDVEVPIGASQEEIDKICGAVLDVMISNELHTGWDKASDLER